MNENLPVIKQIVSLITSQVSPEKIILFGSYARGDNTKNSDVDILIVIKNLENERKLTSLLYKLLLTEDISIPVDLLAIDSSKYDILKNKNGYIYKTIAQEGKIVYE
jgi:predicted nucleotidyltransferase